MNASNGEARRLISHELEMTHTLRNQNSITAVATAMEDPAKEAEILLNEQLPLHGRSTNVISGGQQLARSRTQNR